MQSSVANKSPHDGNAKPSKGTAGAHKALITRNLRLAYGEVASEAVPDRLMELLSQLDQVEVKKP